LEEDAQLEEALPFRLPPTLLALEDTGLGDGDGEAGNYRVSREEIELRIKNFIVFICKTFLINHSPFSDCLLRCASFWCPSS
jgi:hypothetical protein